MHRGVSLGKQISTQRLRKKPKANRTLRVSRGLGVPDSIRTTLKYCESVALTSSSGILTTYVFRANGLYDPDYTSTGHQPYYFDQYALLYWKYCVHACHLKVTVVNDVAHPGGYTVITVRPDHLSGAGPSNTPNTLERPGSALIASTSAYPGHASVFRTTEEMTGLTVNEQLATEELCATTTANPTRLLSAVLSTQAADFTSTNTVHCFVELEFDVTFFDRAQPATS